jgi:hypothetical protein
MSMKTKNIFLAGFVANEAHHMLLLQFSIYEMLIGSLQAQSRNTRYRYEVILPDTSTTGAKGNVAISCHQVRD